MALQLTLLATVYQIVMRQFILDTNGPVAASGLHSEKSSDSRDLLNCRCTSVLGGCVYVLQNVAIR